MRGTTLRILFWYFLPLVAYAAIIFLLSSMSHPPIPAVDLPHFDKVLHTIEYAGLGVLLCRALSMGGRWLSPGGAFIGALLLGALYGASDELHQMFVPFRTGDPFDFLADCFGTALGAGIFRLIWLRGLPP
jgi:VanZ family protein